jgi:hypothetical protein
MSQALFMEKDSASGTRLGHSGEGPWAKMIEKRSAKMPSDIFLWVAIGTIVGSAVLQLVGLIVSFVSASFVAII